MTLRPYSVVHSISRDRRTGKASGVRVIDARTRRTEEFEGRVVFLCASTLESTRILLNSRDDGTPEGLGNSSGVLGRYLMDHWMQAGARGIIPGIENRTTFGKRPTVSYIPRFRNLGAKQGPFLRGYAFQAKVLQESWERGNEIAGVGRQLKEKLRKPGSWYVRLNGFGECLPSESNRVTLDPSVKDAWGIPVPRIECRWGENERAGMRDARAQAVEMLEAAGCTRIEPFLLETPPGLTIHEMGTARMGRDRRTSVLNGWNQAWDVPNLFVTDGACMVSSANQNPSLTYMALTARAAGYAVDLMKRGEL
jgi:choline dehydrogenase-like flavoprotein